MFLKQCLIITLLFNQKKEFYIEFKQYFEDDNKNEESDQVNDTKKDLNDFDVSKKDSDSKTDSDSKIDSDEDSKDREDREFKEWWSNNESDKFNNEYEQILLEIIINLFNKDIEYKRIIRNQTVNYLKNKEKDDKKNIIEMKDNLIKKKNRI